LVIRNVAAGRGVTVSEDVAPPGSGLGTLLFTMAVLVTLGYAAAPRRTVRSIIGALEPTGTTALDVHVTVVRPPLECCDSPAPAELAPVEPVPAEPVPAEPVPVEPVPAELVPVEPVPAEPVPAELVPAELVPAELVPLDPVAAALQLQPDPLAAT
jgi:hypothetical protein